MLILDFTLLGVGGLLIALAVCALIVAAACEWDTNRRLSWWNWALAATVTLGLALIGVALP